MQQSSAAAKSPIRTHGTFLLSDLPDEVLLKIMDKVDNDKDMRCLISSSKQVLCAALRMLKAGRMLHAAYPQRFERRLSTCSQQLETWGVEACSLKVVERDRWVTVRENLLQLLTPCTWLVRLVLVQLPVNSISNLPHLKQLNIWECSRLSKVMDLPHLQQLFVHECHDLHTLSNLAEVQTITISRCSKMTAIRSFNALTFLHASSCGITSITDLPRLQHLYLNQKITGYKGIEHYSYGLTPVKTLSNLPILEVLLADNLFELSTIRCFPALRRLQLTSCLELVSICNLHTLEQLSITDCPALEDISNVPAVQVLQLKAAAVDEMRTTTFDLHAGLLASCSHFLVLEELQLDSCKDTLDLHAFQRLQQLSLSYCPDVEEVSSLSSLRPLSIIRCDSVQNVFDITNLQHMPISRCRGIMEVSALPCLLSLRVAACDGLSNVSHLPRLESLRVSGPLTQLVDVPALRYLEYGGLIATLQDGTVTSMTGQEHLTMMQHLHLHCSKLQCISSHPGLIYLQTSYCHELTQIAGMPALQRLDISYCQSLEALQDFPQLQILNIVSCDKLSCVRGMPRLRELQLKYCNKLSSVADLPELLQLEVQGYLTKFDAVTNLPKLRRLHLEGCDKLTSINGPPALQVLRISSCKQLLSLSGLPELRTLFLASCDNLQHLVDLPMAKEVVIVSDDHAFQMQDIYTQVPRFSTTQQVLTQLSGLPEVQYLECSNPPASISTLTALTKLSLLNTQSLEHIRGLPLLQHLSVVKCGQKLPFDGMLNADGVCDLPALMRLELSYCSKLPSIANFPALQDIRLFECPQMKEFHNLPELRLVHVKLRRKTSKIRHRIRGMPDVDITYDLLGHSSDEYTDSD